MREPDENVGGGRQAASMTSDAAERDLLLGRLRGQRRHILDQLDGLNDEQLLAMANASPAGAFGGAPRAQAGAPNQDQFQRFREQMELQRKRADFLKSEGAALLIDPSPRGDGGTFFVQSDNGTSREKGAAPGGSLAMSGGTVWCAASYADLRRLVPLGDPILGRVLVDGY